MLSRHSHQVGRRRGRCLRLRLPSPSGWRTVRRSGHRWDIGVSPASLSGGTPMLPCLIIVSRNQPELLHALIALYGHEDGVEIRSDRRQGLPWPGMGNQPNRRSPPNADTDLQDHGFIVICRPGTVRSSR